MKAGGWVIWKDDTVGEIVTVYNDGLNLVIRVPILAPSDKTKIEHFNKYEVITVSSNDAIEITKEVADIMRGDL